MKICPFWSSFLCPWCDKKHQHSPKSSPALQAVPSSGHSQSWGLSGASPARTGFPFPALARKCRSCSFQFGSSKIRRNWSEDNCWLVNRGGRAIPADSAFTNRALHGHCAMILWEIPIFSWVLCKNLPRRRSKHTLTSKQGWEGVKFLPGAAGQGDRAEQHPQGCSGFLNQSLAPSRLAQGSSIQSSRNKTQSPALGSALGPVLGSALDPALGSALGFVPAEFFE